MVVLRPKVSIPGLWGAAAPGGLASLRKRLARARVTPARTPVTPARRSCGNLPRI